MLNACPQCSSEALQDRGEIPIGRFFAGKILNPPWNGGRLFACNTCKLVFRYPRRSKAEYEALYQAASSTVWGSEGLRADQSKVIEIIRQRTSTATVLDIGCYDASMLAALGDRYIRYGVEASTAAAEIARKRGIQVIATNVDELASMIQEFDAVTATDVIEHMLDPLNFLRTLALRTKPGGIIVISTGNSEAAAWRRFGGKFWYCTIPEHLSFVSPIWARLAAAQLGLELTSAKTYRYDVPSSVLRRKQLNFIVKLFLAIPESITRWCSPKHRSAGPRISQGAVGIFEDHVILVFSKPSHT
jgi:SAM-dependent methyltransferase